eukprot:scaffold44614_cov73-Attheya_sp.AAC.2
MQMQTSHTLASINANRTCRRVEIAGASVEALMQKGPPDLQGAWNALKGWYREAGDRVPLPSRDTLEKVTTERIALYQKEASPGESIPILVEPVDILSDEIPEMEEIAEAGVRKLCNNR